MTATTASFTSERVLRASKTGAHGSTRSDHVGNLHDRVDDLMVTDEMRRDRSVAFVLTLLLVLGGIGFVFSRPTAPDGMDKVTRENVGFTESF